MSETLDNQRAAEFSQMEERDREIQASIWSMIFLISEISLAFRILRDRLTERGALLPEDEELINTLASQEEHMQVAYAHIERAFREKFQRVMTAMENPEQVTRILEEREQAKSEFIDLNENLPTVSG